MHKSLAKEDVSIFFKAILRFNGKRQQHTRRVNQVRQRGMSRFPRAVLIKERRGFKSCAVDAPCGNPKNYTDLYSKFKITILRMLRIFLMAYCSLVFTGICWKMLVGTCCFAIYKTCLVSGASDYLDSVGIGQWVLENYDFEFKNITGLSI